MQHDETAVLNGAKAAAAVVWEGCPWERLHPKSQQHCLELSRAVLDSLPKREYVHHVLCSGDPKYPAGDGHGCSCFTLHVPRIDSDPPLPRIEPDAGLAQRMKEAYATAVHENPAEDGWLAALRVALNDPCVRPVITDNEIYARLCEIDGDLYREGFGRGAEWYRSEIQKRIDALFAPKVKPWSERYQVRPVDETHTAVFLDGVEVPLSATGCDKFTEAIRQHLIAQKEQEDAR